MKYVESMRSIMQKTGEMVLEHFRKPLKIQYKKDQSIQTDADLLSELFLKDELSALIPGSGFIAEESGCSDIKEFTWVIDPIDGTKNFARGVPYFAINLALMKGPDVIAAVTYLPVLQEWFYAELGQGCWHNGQQVMIGKKDWQYVGALVVVSDFQLRQCELLSKIKQGLHFVEHGVRFRVGGAAAVDLAYAARGSFDAVLFEELGWWDAAAGKLLISEAGGWVSQYDKSPVNQSFKNLIAGDREICQAILPHLI